MTTLGKRTLIKMIGLSAVSMAVLTACGKKKRLLPLPPQLLKLQHLQPTS